MQLNENDMAALSRIIRIASNEYVVHAGDLPDTVLIRVWDLIRTANAPLEVQAAAVVAEALPIKKIQMIKDLRDRTQCGLRESKDAIDNALVEWLSKELDAARAGVAAKESARNGTWQSGVFGSPFDQ